MKLFSAVLTSLTLLCTTNAHAAFNSPAEVLAILAKTTNEPRDIAITVYGESNEGSLHITATGKTSGTTLQNLQMDMNINVKVYMPQQGTIELLSWFKVTDGNMYLRAQSDDVFINSFLSEVGLHNRNWLYIPLLTLLEQEGINFSEQTKQEEVVKKVILRHVNNLLNMEQENYDDRDEYVLSLQPGFVQNIIPMLQDLQKELGEEILSADELPSKEELAELEAMLNSMLTLKARITMSKSDEFLRSRAYAAINYTDTYESGKLVLDSTISATNEPFSVVVPAQHLLKNIIDSMELEQITEFTDSPVQNNAIEMQRSADVLALQNALQRYAIENNGRLPAKISGSEKEICVISGPRCGNLIDLHTSLVENYLLEIPSDPIMGNSVQSGYTVHKDASDNVIVRSRYSSELE